jgi:hypothetical protein
MVFNLAACSSTLVMINSRKVYRRFNLIHLTIRLYMSLSGIKTNMQKLDYSWSNPAAYSVVIPGLSLIVQKVQLYNLLPMMTDVKPHNFIKADMQARQFMKVCDWHMAGSMVQIIATAFLVNYFAIPMLALIAVPAVYEFLDTAIKRLRNRIVIYQLPVTKGIPTTQSCIF